MFSMRWGAGWFVGGGHRRFNSLGLEQDGNSTECAAEVVNVLHGESDGGMGSSREAHIMIH